MRTIPEFTELNELADKAREVLPRISQWLVEATEVKQAPGKVLDAHLTLCGISCQLCDLVKLLAEYIEEQEKP